jgi:hypothetical protein
VSDLEDRVMPDLEARVEEAVAAFRETHTHPANLALHAVAALSFASAAGRLLRGRVFSALARTGLGIGLLVAGHRIEGNEPFDLVRRIRPDRP